MMPVVFHSEARAELRDAATRYETHRAGLGADFRAEVEIAIARIQRNPQAFTLIDAQGTRRCLVNRFPYSILFREVEGVIWIGAVAHQRRRPGYWSSRTPED